MTQHEHESRRQELEARYRGALEILEAGHRAQLEELERLWVAEREAEPERKTLEPAPGENPEMARRESGYLLDEIRAALDRLPEEFDKNNLLRVLGFSPHRSSLFRTLQQLEWEGRIAHLAVSDEHSGASAERFSVLPKRSVAPRERSAASLVCSPADQE
jgi:hypothetical protein